MPSRAATSFDKSVGCTGRRVGIDDQARRELHRREAIAEFANHGLGARPVQPQDASTHRGVGGCAQLGGDVGGKSEPSEDRSAIVDAARSQCVDHLLTNLRCLPRLRHVVPDVVGVQDAGDVADPRPHQVRAAGERTVDVARAPVVTEQIDLRSTRSDRVEFADQPLGVVVHRGIEPVGDRRAEARRRQRNHARSSSLVQRCGQRTPDRGGLRVAVDEDDGALGHASRP